ncbi:MAG: MOSC domain-containing protein [Bdellovibrionota bacterium]
MSSSIGILKNLRRYPVKSFRGEELTSALVSYSGLAGDRVYAFVDPAKTGNFPWLTARQIPEMILFEPRFIEPPADEAKYPDPARAFRIEVRTPEGETHELTDPAFLRKLEARWQRPFQLRFSEKGMQDARPLSLFSAPTLALLSSKMGSELDARRFRPNFFVEWENGKALYEEELLGRRLQIGEKLQILISKKDPRCVIINLDPLSAAPNPEVLKTVGKEFRGNIGVYAVVLQEGAVRAGDQITLLD